LRTELIFGCVLAAAQGLPSIAAQQVNPPLDEGTQQLSKPAVISITVLNPVVVVGSPIKIAITLKNTASYDINATAIFEYPPADVDRSYGYIVQTDTGIIVPPTVVAVSDGSTSSIRFRSLPPGQLERAGGELFQYDLPPGNYLIQVERMIAPYSDPKQNGITVKSNEIAITVVPKRDASQPGSRSDGK